MSSHYSEVNEEAEHLEDVKKTLWRKYLNRELYVKKGKRFVRWEG